MSDSHAGYIVTLEKPLKDEDARAIENAIKQIKCVIDVVPVVADHTHYMAVEQAKFEMREKIWSVVTTFKP